MRRSTGDELEERRPERVDVDPSVEHALRLGLLGRHVGRGADDDAGACQTHVILERDTEINELGEDGFRRARLGDEEDVRRLDVAVNHAGPVRGVEGDGDLPGNLERVAQPERGAAVPRREVLSLEPFHGHVGRLVERPASDEPHDVRVVELLEEFALAHEAGLFGSVDALDADELQGDPLAFFAVEGPVNHPHAPSPDLPLDLEPSTERRALAE